jgi:hypothetical protein
VFVAVDHLRRADLLSEEEEEIYFEIDDWFNDNLPNPPFYNDGNEVGAITWFKSGSGDAMLTRLRPLTRILDDHGVAWVICDCNDPGEIIYEDQFQVGAIPPSRFSPEPVPHGRPMADSTPGSKRALGKRARLRTS